MNCSYFAMERRRTFKVNKKNKGIKQKNKYKYKKQNKKTTNKQTNQNKTKPKYINERTKNTLHTLSKI